MLIKWVIFHNINKIMQFKIFNHSQCKKVKYLHPNKHHLIHLKLEDRLEHRLEEELVGVLVAQLNQKKEREEDGEIITPDLDPTRKMQQILLKVQSHQESVVD